MFHEERCFRKKTPSRPDFNPKIAGLASGVRIDSGMMNGYALRVADSTHQTELTDFPDWLSPVLVKELRQGLRTNLFVTAFILLQGFMILCLLNPDSGGDSFASQMFWFFIAATFLGIQPLRGFSSLSSEFSYNTMDMVQLTNLNALRIAFGKWSALNAQSLLLFVTVIPYLVLRYFFGSVDLVGDATRLISYAFMSAILSAITVGCSSFKNFLTRLLLLIVTIVLFSALASNISNYALDFVSTIAIAFSGIVVGTYFILFGASKIAPQSENHATRKRLVGLIGGFTIAGLTFAGLESDLALIACMAIVGLAVIDAITEDLPVFHGVLPPFSKNFLTRKAANLLSPGWHTGACYLVIAYLPLAYIIYVVAPTATDTSILSRSLLVLAAVIFPLLFIHLFFKRSNLSRVALYIAIQACVLALAFLVTIVSDAIDYELREIVYLLIPIPGILLIGADSIESSLLLIISTAWVALTFLVLFFSSRKPFHDMRRYFAESKKLDQAL